jgi:3-oxo-5-alpha-steroid 4-dehydrogenase 1
MSELEFYNLVLKIWLGMAVIACVTLGRVTAPYGRYVRTGWGPSIRSRVGWFLMEAPSAIGFFIWFMLGKGWQSPVACVFLALFEFHYIYRAFIYPFTLRDQGKRIPLAVASLAAVFNLVNSYLNARYLFSLSGGYPLIWLLDGRFLVGAILFFWGITINRKSDAVLRGLRKSGETGYRIPYGGWYRWVSCPNYLGEIIEWFGWSIATWSLPGLSFAIWTVANLLPRALDHHQWYLDHFPNYPAERQALLPIPRLLVRDLLSRH